MNHYIRTSAAIGIACFGLATASNAYAGPNAAIDALGNTPVSMLTYGLAALSEGVNGYLGQGGKPAPSALFAAPLSGRVADFATILLDQPDGTITINLIHIAELGAGTPDDACRQAFATMHLFAAADPASGQLPPGMVESTLPAFFEADGTPATTPAGTPTLDQAFRLRFNGVLNGKRFVCTAPFFGSDYKVDVLK